jgi:hypothetical protein
MFPCLQNKTSSLSHVTHTMSAGDFLFVCLIWESPPTISLRVTRKLEFIGRCQRFEGKGLVVVGEGISTPSAP